MADIYEDKDAVSYSKFLGLRNTVAQSDFEPGDLEVALNVDQTDAYRLRRRKGFSATPSTASYHSLWSNGTVALMVSGTSLMEVMPDFTTRVLRNDLTPGLRMDYDSMGNRVFFSNGAETGVFQDHQVRTWGIAVPFPLPLVSLIGGSLPPGRYQYAMTFVRSDGQESGTGNIGGAVGNIVLPPASTAKGPVQPAGGLQFTQLPVSSDPDVLTKRLYISPVNGEALYSLFTLPNSATVATYTTERMGTLPLQTQFLAPAPPTRDVTVFNGHILSVRGSILYRSEAFSPELFDLRKGLPFASRITLVAPMYNGVYLGTDTELFWMQGRRPDQWEITLRLNVGVIFGTLAYVRAEELSPGQQGFAAIFATPRGIFAGMPDGSLIDLTEERFNYPAMDEGAAVVRLSGGSVQYLVTLRGTERPGNTAF